MSVRAGSFTYFSLVIFISIIISVPGFSFDDSQSNRNSINEFSGSDVEVVVDELDESQTEMESRSSRATPKNYEATWIQKGLPPARSEHAVVFDPKIDVLYMYGGWDLGNELSDLWKYETAGDEWWDINDGENPGGRHDHCMILETVDSNIYLFGGYDSKDMLNDLWMFDTGISEWSPVDTGTGNPPDARRGHCMVYDSEHHQIFVFGGTDGSDYFNDVWIFNIDSGDWSTVSISGTKPTGRSNAAMVYETQNNHIYLYGGFDGTEYLDDFYRFDVSTLSWSQITPLSLDNPPSRAEHTMTYHSTDGRVYMFGGIYLTISDVKEYRADFWYYDTATNQWSQPEDGAAPGPRAKHAMTIDSLSGEIYIMQGYSGEFREDLWRYRISENRWYALFESSPVKSPSIRNGQGLIFDPVGNALYYFGGYYNDGQPHYREDMWKFQLANKRWDIVNEGTGPEARFARGVVYDEHRHEIYMFGGYYYDFFGGTRNYLNDLWLYNLTTDSWAEIDDGLTVPEERDGHTMIYDPVNQDIYLHGGRKWVSGTTYTYYGDLWKYDVSGKTWTDLTDGTTVSQRSRQAMCYDSRNRDIYVYGGMNESGYNNEMWKYNIATGNWTVLSPTGSVPTERGAHSLVYDRYNDDIYLFSGKDQDTPVKNILNDFYKYNVTTNNWMQISLTMGEAPTPRTQYGFVYDHINQKIYLSGGYYYDTADRFYADLWEFEWGLGWTEIKVERPYPEPCTDSRFSENLGLFGGWNGDRYLDRLWYYDYLDNKFKEEFVWSGGIGGGEMRIPGRRSHGVVDGNILTVFGGNNGSDIDDMWRYPVNNEWNEIIPSSIEKPSARSRFSMVYAGDYQIFLFGGWNGASLGDLWKFDEFQEDWIELNPSGTLPSARQRHAMVADRENDYLYLFGGFDTTLKYKNDLWRYDIKSNSWMEITGVTGSSPTPRDSHGLFFDSVTNSLFVFGGKDSNNIFNDFYRFDINHKLWLKIENTDSVPSPRHSFAYTFNENMRTIYIYGGWSNSYKGDLWSWKVPYRNVTLLNATFDNGDGEDDKTCYSKFRYYEFEVSVKDAVSYKYLDKVSIQLGSGIEIFWNEAIDEFIVIDPNNYIELSSNSYAEHDESQTWLIHYLVKFNWTYPTESYQNVQASAWNKNGFTDSILKGSDIEEFRVENDLDFEGEPVVVRTAGGMLAENDWVRAGEEIQWASFNVVYQGAPITYLVPTDECKAGIWDDDGDVWYDTNPSPNVVIVTTADNKTDVDETYTINITGIPPSSINRTITYKLKIDGDPLLFSDPKPSSTELNTKTKVQCSINITDTQNPEGSGVNASTIKYSITTNGGMSWSDWKNAGLMGTTLSSNPTVEVDFEEGFKNYIRWRAYDAAGNGPFTSNDNKIIVDTSYSPSAPTAMLLSPSDQSIVTELKPTFVWTGNDPDEDDIVYDLYVGLDESKVRDRDSTLKAASGVGVPIHTLKNELRDGFTYYWTIIPHDADYTGRCLSDVWNFTVQTSTVDIPTTTLLIPSDGEIISSTTPGLEWQVNYTGSKSVNNLIIVYPKPDDMDTADFYSPLSISDYKTSVGGKTTFNVPDDILWNGSNYEWLVIPSAGGIIGKCQNGPRAFSINLSYRIIYRIDLTTPSEYPVYPDSNISTSVTVKNAGNVEDIYEIGLASDDFEGNVQIEYSGSSFKLASGSSKKLTMNITVPDSIKPGIYPVKVTVTSSGSGGSIYETATINIKVLGDEPITTPDDKEGGLESWLLALIIVVIVAVIVLVLLFVVISKKRKSKEDKAALEPVEAGAEVSYIPKDAFGSERDAIATYRGTQVEGGAPPTGLPTVAAGEAGAAGVVTPTEALPPQVPYESQPVGVEQPEVPSSPYEGAVAEAPAEPPTPDGWQPAPQLPPSETQPEQPAGEEVVRYDTMDEPAPAEKDLDQSQIESQDQIEYPEPQEQQEQYYQEQPQQYQQEQYPPQQAAQQYIPCVYCGAQNVYGQQNCTHCGNLLSYY